MQHHNGHRVRQKNIFSQIKNFICFDDLFSDGIPLKYVSLVLFGFLLGVIYIFNSYNSSHLMNEENKLNDELLTLKTEYMVLKSDFDTLKLQSNVISQGDDLGLKKSNVPPKILHLEK